MQVVLTGGIASGKTAVSNLFSQHKITIVDADIVAREIVAPNSNGLSAIVDYFGSGILNKDKTLNRTLLRSIVFEDEQERQWLNNLLHPMIRSQMHQQRQSSLSDYTISVIPLLYETKQVEHFDRVLVVDVPQSIQVNRLMSRDGSTQEQVDNILASQATREQRLSIADDVIDNSKDLQSLEHQVIKLHNLYLSLAKR